MKTKIAGQAVATATLPADVAGGAPALQCLIISIALAIFCSTGFAQNVERISKREIQRRQAAVTQGQEAMARAAAAVATRDYALAHDQYRIAVNFLPDGAVSGDSYSGSIEGFCDTGIKLAEQRIAEGKYDEAEVIVREILDPKYNPN